MTLKPDSILAFLVCLLFSVSLSAQQPLPYPLTPSYPSYKKPNSIFYCDSTVNKKRFYPVAGIMVGSYTTMYTALGLAWYSDVPKSSFHFFEDFSEWKQFDKAGHAMGAYQSARGMIQLYKWAGTNKKKTLLYSGIGAYAMMSTIEVFDGFSSAWGASPSDLGFNALGTGLAVTNEALWNEQRLQLKISYHDPVWYGDPDWASQRPDLLGSGIDRIVKDYNGHTIWLSGRVHSFLPEGKFKDKYPKWLNVAVGYGAEGMLGEWDDPTKADEIREREYRQYYLSFDLDLAAIETSSGFLDFLLGTFNFIHFPSPALEYNRKDGMKFHWIFF